MSEDNEIRGIPMREIVMPFPIRGLGQIHAYSEQPEMHSVDLYNVRPLDQAKDRRIKSINKSFVSFIRGPSVPLRPLAHHKTVVCGAR